MYEYRTFPVEVLQKLYFEKKFDNGEFNLELVDKEGSYIVDCKYVYQIVIKDLKDSRYFATDCVESEDPCIYDKFNVSFQTNCLKSVTCREVKPVTKIIYE